MLVLLFASLGAMTPGLARDKREPKIYVANRDYPPAAAIHVAVVPFAMPHNNARWGREAARVVRKRFHQQDFDLVHKAVIDDAVAAKGLSPKRVLSDKTLIEIGSAAEADWVVHGRISKLWASSPKFLGLPLPSGRDAKCSLDTRIVEVKTGDLIFRSFSDVKGDVGSQWSTNSFEARHRIIARAVRHLYDPLFERIPALSADLYKRRSYVADDALYTPDETSVVVLPFADVLGRIRSELTVTNATRDVFAREGFHVVDPDKVDYALSKLPHDLAEDHSDAMLRQLGDALEADIVVYGEIMHLQVEDKRLPGVRMQFPLPARKRASAVLKAKIVDVASGQVVYRSQRKADDAVAGVEFLTANGDVRARTAKQCVRYIFSDFFELCVEE